MKKHLVRILLGLAVTLVFLGHAARYYQIGFLNQLDSTLYDVRLQLTMPRDVDKRVVILDIDEKSLERLGHWPWSRDLIARLITKLFDEYHVALIGFDVFFSERDDTSGIKTLDGLSTTAFKDNPAFQNTYKELRPKLDFDQTFADAIKERPVVLGYTFSDEKEGAKELGSLPTPVMPAGTFRGRPIPFITYSGYIGNLGVLQNSAADAGHVDMVPDDDGIVRRVPMIVEFKGAYYESLSLAMLRTLVALDSGAYPKVVPGYAEEKYGFASRGYQGLEWLEVQAAKGHNLRIPVDNRVATLIPYRGNRGSFKYISLADVEEGKVKPEDLKGKIALIGTSAQGLLDLRATPVNTIYPGVEVH
ncbi:MAG: CHASE2 domain-containing protein, partial [Candidatus Eremiobacteraeota bacterium]|nr:CHASE2 domain-containing protein [Candidatus Eremiobacteraeota bacterium]